jgi:hypothetical protein
LVIEGWWKEDAGRTRPTSAAFFSYDGGPGEISCYLETTSGRDMFRTRFPNAHAARFTALQARSCGFNITSDPEGDPDGSNDHVVLTFNDPLSKRSVYQKACKQLALLSIFIHNSEFLPAS